MAKLSINRGSQSINDWVFIQDASNPSGAPLKGLNYKSANLTWNYINDLMSSGLSIPITSGVVGTYLAPGISGSFTEINSNAFPGLYQVSYPNYIFASGTRVTSFLYGANNMIVNASEYQIQNPALDANIVSVNSISTTPYQGIAVTGTINSITLASTEPTDCSVYNGRQVIITSGVGIGQARTITNAVGQVAYVNPNWLTIPYSGSSAYNIDILSQVNLNINQAIPPTGLIIESLGDCLMGGRVQAYGNFIITQIGVTGLLLSLYSASGYLIKSFEMAQNFSTNINPTIRY